MEADRHVLKRHADYNLASMSFSAADLAAEIRRHIPEFTVTYRPDPAKQAIADSWPKTIDDSAARRDWGWQPGYDLATMTTDMLEKLAERKGERALTAQVDI
jgi:nucleoside-diphosphate-sugar epimerase